MLKILIDIKKSSFISLLLAYGMSIIIAILVYLSGGTTKVYANLMYVPIAFIASTRGKKDAMVHAIFSGLLVGPFMPLNVVLGLPQDPKNWIIRVLIYIIIAFIIGFFYDYGEKNKEYITNLLTHDRITGLANMESLKHEGSLRFKNRVIISLSIKGYEQTLRLFSYNFSKEFITRVSRLLEEEISKHYNMDLVRYDGMEFVIIINEDLESISDDEVIELLGFLNKRVIVVDDIPIYMETITGISRIDETTSIEEGVRQSLIALRYAIVNHIKHMEYNLEIDNYYKNVVDIGANFRIALKNNNIKAAFQKIYDAKTERPVGVEMLVRWVKDDKTMVPPIMFIPVIENTELVNELTRFMVDQAIDFYRSSDQDLLVSLNFSPNNFNLDSVNYIINKVKELKFDSSKFRIEITEEIFFHEEKSFKYLNMLSEAGFKIALDDFGTGYSSYKMVMEMPLDVIKIDKSMIDDVACDKASSTLVESIIYFCKLNNTEIVAEGVETKEVADKCRDLGIDYLQGYYYHKPEIIQ